MRLPLFSRILALAAAALADAGCGKRGDPLPPLRRTPQAVTELAVAQRGTELEIRIQTPRATTEGERLGIVTLEILSATTDGDLAKVATRREQKAAPGERLVLTEKLPVPGTLVRVAAVARSGKRTSTQSPARSLRVADPVPAPSALVAGMQPEGVLLRFVPPDPMPAWIEPPKPSPTPTLASPRPSVPPPGPPAEPEASPPLQPALADTPPTQPGGLAPQATTSPEPTPTPEPTPPPTAGIRLYRRGDPGSYGAPLREELLHEGVYLDATAPLGRTACYVARTVVAADPLIESEPSNEACLAVEDKQPPAAPSGITTLAVDAGLEISWSPSGEPDLVLYRVYRVAPGETPVRVAEVRPPETRGVDGDAPQGRVQYFVTAVDAAGNESPPSPRVEGARR